MSSNCPPQLQLSLPANTTSFKRSFEQFGFDLESPVGGTDGAGSSGSDGNDRNKRARSTSRFSDDNDSVGSSQSSTVASGSNMSFGGGEPDAAGQATISSAETPDVHGAAYYPLSLNHTSEEPPRLPTPVIQDIEMVDYPLTEPIPSEPPSPVSNEAPSSTHADESYRLSLERFNTFDGHISLLRSSRSPALARSPTSPPVLPPLELLGDEPSLDTGAIPFINASTRPPSPPSPPSLEPVYSLGPGSRSVSSGDSRPLSRETISRNQSENSRPQRVPRQQASDGISHRSRGSSRENPGSGARPFIEISPDALWSRYDESPSPTSDDQEFEFTGLRGGFSSALELRSTSPLFGDLDDVEPPNRPVETSPPTLPPLHDNWDDPLEDLITYSSNAPRAESSDTRRSPSSFSPSAPYRNMPLLVDVQNQLTSGSGSEHRHSVSSPLFSPSRWIESNSTLFGLPVMFPPSPTLESADDPLSRLRRDITGSRRSSGVSERVDRLRNPSRIPSTGRPHLSSRDSSVVDNRTSDADTRLSVFRAMLSSDHRAAQASPNVGSVNSQPNEEDASNRRLRFSDVHLGTPLAAQMQPWLTDRARENSSSPTMGGAQRDLLSGESYNVATGSRRATRHAHAHSVETNAQEMLSDDAVDTLDILADTRQRPRQSRVYRSVSPPPRISPSEFITAPLFSGEGPTLYESITRSWNQDSDNGRERASVSQGTATPASQDNVHSDRPETVDTLTSSARPISSNWSWDDSATVEVERLPPSPPPLRTDTNQRPSPFSSTDMLRLRSRLHNSPHRPSQPSSTSASTGIDAQYRPSRRDLLVGTTSRPSLTSFERHHSFDPDRSQPFRSVPHRRESSPPRSVAFTGRQLPGDNHDTREAYRNIHSIERDQTSLERSILGPGEYGWSHVRSPAPSGLHVGRSSSSAHEDVAGRNRHRRSQSLAAELRHDLEAHLHREPRDSLPRTPEQSFLEGFVYLDVPSLPSPGLGEIFGQPEPERPDRSNRTNGYGSYSALGADSGALPNSSGNSRHRTDSFDSLAHNARAAARGSLESTAERAHRMNPFHPYPSLTSPSSSRNQRADTSDSPAFHVNFRNVAEHSNPPSRGHRISLSDSLRHGEARQNESAFSRRRSPSPTRHHYGTRRGPSATTGPPVLPPSTSEVPRTIDANSFAPGPFRNTMQRLFELDMARENRSAPPPSIPPLTFENDASSPSPPRNRNSSEQHNPRSRAAMNQTSQPFRPLYDNTPSERERDEDWSWDDGHEPPSNPRRPASWRYAISRRQPPVDLHTYLTRHGRTEAPGTATPQAPQPPRHPPLNGDVEGFNHAMEILRHDGLSNSRSRQLITRFHNDREQTHSGLSSSRSLSSPWGIIDHPGTTPSDSRTSRESPSWSNAAHNERRNDASTPRHRLFGNTGAASSDSDRERVAAQGRTRRIRLARQYDIGIFTPAGLVQDYLGRIGRRERPSGDYVRDEDFDESYESLLSLAATLGEVKPRATPDTVIAGMDTGLYKDWKTPDSDHRCPICLDDYQPDDSLLKLTDCSHWLHKECLQQWLKGASTCPVCRRAVGGSPGRRTFHRHNNHPSNDPGPSWRYGNPGSGAGSSGSGGSALGGAADRAGRNRGATTPPWRYE